MRSKEIESYKQKLKLSDNQREILVGTLLGDAHLESRDAGRTYRIKIEQSERHKDYVEHLYREFAEWVRTPPQAKSKERNRKGTVNWWFQTLSHSAFRFYAQQFYRNDKKYVPKLIHRWLTPKALAYWFMDDGSIKSKQSKALVLNTQCFELREVEHLCRVLKDKFLLDAKPRVQRDGYQIFISGRSYERLHELIGSYVVPSMQYKLPVTRKT